MTELQSYRRGPSPIQLTPTTVPPWVTICPLMLQATDLIGEEVGQEGGHGTSVLLGLVQGQHHRALDDLVVEVRHRQLPDTAASLLQGQGVGSGVSGVEGEDGVVMEGLRGESGFQWS